MFANEVEDLITIATLQDDPGFTRFGYANVDAARIRGAEAGARTGVDGVEVGVSYMFTDAVDRASGTALEGRARHRGTADTTVRRGPASGHVRAVAVGPRPFLEDDALVEAPAYLQLDLRAAYDVGRSVDLFAGVENLLDAGDPDRLPLPPRVVYAGLDGRFGGGNRSLRGEP